MYLAPKINAASAQNLIRQKKSLFFKKVKLEKAPLKRIELIYLPFFIFEACLEKKAGDFSLLISVDALEGSPAFFKTELNTSAELPPNPVCEFIISSAVAEQVARDFCRGYILEQGLRLKNQAQLKHIQLVQKLFYPFWVGYFQKGNKYDFKALDAIAGVVEGIRMRKVFLKAFRFLN